MNNKLSLPVNFELVEDLQLTDSRFIPVKVFIAHDGENRNNSIFSKDVLESMIPSLANVPILGYLNKDDENLLDFKGHEERLVVENNGFNIKYFGHAYGMIPSENNARFELRYGEDGVEREYLVCDGLLWRKFKEVEDIFDRDGGFKSQSMELEPSSVEGYTNEQGLFVFTKAKFEGLCILGEGVTPAMISSTIEKFTASEMKIEFSEMLKEFNAHFSAIKEKGDDIVEDNKLQTEFTEDNQLDNETLDTQTEFAEDDKEKDEVVEDDVVEDDKDEDDEDEDKFTAKGEVQSEKFTRTFELSHDDIRYSLYQALDGHDSFKDKWYWISKVFDNHAIVEDESEGKFFKVNYVKHENAVSIGEFSEVFAMYVSSSEKQAIELARNNFEALQEELEGLKTFKANIELSDKEHKLSQYSSILSQEEYTGIKENLSKFSMEEIEKEIGFMLLKKNHFSANKVEEPKNRIPATTQGADSPYGSLATYFTK